MLHRRVIGGIAITMLGALGVFACWESEPPLPVAEPIVVDAASRVIPDRLGPSETLSHLFARHGVGAVELQSLLEVARTEGLDPRRVRPDREFEFRELLPEGSTIEVRTRSGDDGFLVLTKTEDGWTSEVEPIDWNVTLHTVRGSISSSLNQSIHDLLDDDLLPHGEKDRLVWTAAEAVYGWVVDFTRDIREDDRYEILFERLESSAGDIRLGRVMAAKLVVQGRDHPAYLLEDDGSELVTYYDDEGRSLHRAFLRYPVQFRRISGVFTRRRFHPVLRRYRAHLGYDFAADTGTPIRATGNGVVWRADRWGGYGIMVGIRHPKGIETRYAHMSRIASGIRPGVRVTQGQTIGYVGQTGTATGPHVHYEFLKNGEHINYRNIDLGDGDPVPAERREAFEQARAHYNLLLRNGDQAAPINVDEADEADGADD